MRRKQNGMTIVEILVSILLITIVITLLFNMLINIRKEDVENSIQSDFLLIQATFIKAVEEDVVNYGVRKVSPCNLSEADIPVELLNSDYENDFKCIKFEYAADYTKDNIGFLMIYNTYDKFDFVAGKYQGLEENSKWMIQYKRGHYKFDQTHNEIGNPGYDINNPDISTWENLNQTMRPFTGEVDLSDKIYLSYTAAEASLIGGMINNYNAANLVVPIVNSTGQHYDLNIAFTFLGNENFKCGQTDSKMLECRCKSNDQLCQKTYEY